MLFHVRFHRTNPIGYIVALVATLFVGGAAATT